MDWTETAQELSGLQTIETIEKELNITRHTAANYVAELRKKGFVKTSRGAGKKRMYQIRPYPFVELGNPGLFDIINKYSAVKITEPYVHRIHGRKLTIEEVIVRAVKTRDFRIILACLGLFRHANWPLLRKYAKKEKLERAVGALYDLSKHVIKKTGTMNKRTEQAMLRSTTKDKYIIPKMKSKDFKDIEKKWGVFIPFNKSDLFRYKEVEK